MTVDVQKEYSRLRAELDKLRTNSYTSRAEHEVYDRKVSVLQNQIDALKPKLLQSQPQMRIRTLPTAEELVARLEYSTDPNSDFQKALKNVKSEADAKKIEDAKKKQIADLEANYLSDKKTKDKAIESAKKASENSRKAVEDAARLEKENAIRAARGLDPIVAKKQNTVLPFGTQVPSDYPIEKQFTDGMAGNVNSVYMGTQPVPAARNIRFATGTKAKIVPAQEAIDMFVKDPKLQAKVIESMKNAGIDNANQLTAYVQWQSYVDQARLAYRGGQGLIITPMDVLNMSLKANGGSRTSTSRSMTEFSPDAAGSLIDSIFQNTLGMNPTDAQRNKYLAEFKAASDKGSVTTTTTSGNSSSSFTKTGPSQQDMAAKLTNQIKKSPEFSTDLQERQALDFGSAIDKLMSRGM